jgi:tRNA G10  N-methylase Trm11
MKYLFELGRNPELSILELKSYFEREVIGFEILKKVKNGVLVEVSSELEKGIVNRLGGVISIGKVLVEDDVCGKLETQNLYSGTSNKLNYVVLDFDGKELKEVLEYLKQRFRDEKLKATLKHVNGFVKMQDGKIFPKVSSKLVNERYFLFENYFGKIVEVCDYDEIEKRDMGKPVRRNELSISPRLAKIMINLSGAEEGETLLDCFCGIGVVLQEALLQKMKVVGIDRDKSAIEGAKSNLEWFKFAKKNYELINSDSSQIEISQVKGIATEPDLGALQKGAVSSKIAKQTLEDFEKLMIRVLNNLKNSVDGKIVFTAPLILSGKKRVGCDFEKIVAKTGLKIVEGPVADFRKDSIVGRDIVVLN